MIARKPPPPNFYVTHFALARMQQQRRGCTMALAIDLVRAARNIESDEAQRLIRDPAWRPRTTFRYRLATDRKGVFVLEPSSRREPGTWNVHTFFPLDDAQQMAAWRLWPRWEDDAA